jgi:hypothetical protein
LFSKPPSDAPDANFLSTNSSESSGRLTKVRNRMSSASSATHLAPDHLAPDHLAPDHLAPVQPAAPRHVSLMNPTMESTDLLQPLEPPPPLSVPGPRTVSPSGSRSRPGTPNDSANEGNLKKLRRRSKMFGGSAGDTGAGATQGQHSPVAWIAGHRVKVEYNLGMLLSGEQVRGSKLGRCQEED